MPSNRFFSLVAVSAICAASGCARFHARPISAQANASAFTRRSLHDEGLRDFIQQNRHGSKDWPYESWNLNDLTLAALYFHPDLNVARAQWAEAQAARRTASERPNPTLTFLPAYDTTTSIPSPWIVQPMLDIPIETAGKRKYRMAEAAQLSEQARLNVANMAWQIRSRLRRALVNLYSATELEKLLREQQSLHTENLRLLQHQKDAGVVSAFELTQAGIAADTAQLALRDAERQKEQARIDVADSIGLPVSAIKAVKISFDGLEAWPKGNVLDQAAQRAALLHRTDILAALAEYKASESALQLEIAKQYPDVHFTPNYLFDQGDNKWSLGFTVTLPLLNHNQGAVAQAKAKRDEVAARFEALQAKVIADTERAVVAYRTSQAKKADADALLQRLQNQEKRARGMFEIGEISKADTAALRLQLSTSAVARLGAVTEAQQSLGLLEDALQVPFASSATWEKSPLASTQPNSK